MTLKLNYNGGGYISINLIEINCNNNHTFVNVLAKFEYRLCVARSNPGMTTVVNTSRKDDWSSGVIDCDSAERNFNVMLNLDIFSLNIYFGNLYSIGTSMPINSYPFSPSTYPSFPKY